MAGKAHPKQKVAFLYLALKSSPVSIYEGPCKLPRPLLYQKVSKKKSIIIRIEDFDDDKKY